MWGAGAPDIRYPIPTHSSPTSRRYGGERSPAVDHATPATTRSQDTTRLAIRLPGRWQASRVLPGPRGYNRFGEHLELTLEWFDTHMK